MTSGLLLCSELRTCSPYSSPYKRTSAFGDEREHLWWLSESLGEVASVTTGGQLPNVCVSEGEGADSHGQFR